MSRSSIFSFETWQLTGSDLRRIAQTLAIVGVIVGGLELATREALRPVGDLYKYWTFESGVSFESFQRLVQSGMTPRIVVAGDSTGHSDISAPILEEQVGGGATAWNLSSPGNFVMAFEQSTLPVLEKLDWEGRTAVLSFIPAGFVPAELTQGERGIVNSLVCKNQGGDTDIGDYLWMCRIRKAVRPWVSLRKGKEKEIVANKGAAPHGGDGEDGVVRNGAAGKVSTELNEQRQEVLRKTVKMLVERGAKVVLVIPPTTEQEIRRDNYESYRKFLAEMRTSMPLEVVDLWADGGLVAEDFTDRNHLNATGARKASELIGRKLAEMADAS